MKISCPHCSQRLSLDNDDLASLRDTAGFACPACAGLIPLPETAAPDDEAATQALHEQPAGGWVAPDPVEFARSFDARYQIRRLLGRGGMGAVYEGFDTRLDRRVAIKILPMETGRDPSALARFEREAKAMAALDHPNIVHIHDFGTTADGHPYLIMEFIDGMDVHRLRQGGHLDLPGALEIISQVCSALQYAHSRGIVHRDIKPANIMVSRDGLAKVADFGLAKVLGTDSHPHHDPTITRSGAAMGTLDYMAPEQMEGHRVDHRADIYSLGVMLYDLLTGSPPRGAWPPPSQRVRIDVRLDEIVLRALQQNPAARYQAAAEVRDDIDSVKSSTGGEPLPPGVNPEPLPSTRSSLPVATLHPMTSAPGGKPASRANSAAAAARPEADEIAASASSLGTTTLILGLLAITIIGGLAFYLANRKTGDTIDTKTTLVNSQTHNSYFNQLISTGITTPKDLDAIGEIRPYGDGFIAISKNSLDWRQARDLAQSTGAKVLPVGESGPGACPALRQWLNATYLTPLAAPLWVMEKGEPRLLDNSGVLPALTTDRQCKAILQWGAAADGPQSAPENPAAKPAPTPSTPAATTTPAPLPTPAPVPITATPSDDVGPPSPTNADDQTIPTGWRAQLNSPDPNQRELALQQLGSLGKLAKGEAAAVEALIKDPKWSVQFAAARALPELLGAELAATRFDSITRDPSQERARGAALVGLETCGIFGLPTVEWALKSPEESIQYQALITASIIDSDGTLLSGILPLLGNNQPEKISSQARKYVLANGIRKFFTAYSRWPADLPEVETYIRKSIPLITLSELTKNRQIRFEPEPDGSLKVRSYTPQPGATFQTGTFYVIKKPQSPTRTHPAVLSWTNAAGVSIPGEFLRLAGEAVVIRMDGKLFTIPFAKLSPASVEQAKKLAAGNP